MSSVNSSDEVAGAGSAAGAAKYGGSGLGEIQSFQLEPLVEMGVVGACRRGRRRGRRNRTATERQSEVEQRRYSKNARERERVENVRNEYVKLQRLLGLEDLGAEGSRSKEGGRFCKLRTLTAAIARIKSRVEQLRLADEEESSHGTATVRHHNSSSNFRGLSVRYSLLYYNAGLQELSCWRNKRASCWTNFRTHFE